MIDINISLTEKQKIFLKAIDDYRVTFYGGAKGGGKSHGLRTIMLLRRFVFPGSTGAIFRKTFPELEGNHIRPIFRQYPQLRPYYNESKKLLTLPNGSTLEFCHCATEADVDLYQGREYHDLGIEEAGQWTEAMFKRLRGSNRSARKDIKPRTLLTGNPGGIGHKWLKRMFIERRFVDLERPEDYFFIQALVDDNPALIENDPDYVHTLDSEPNEALRKAFRYGDWDIFAGQFFSEIRREVHLIKPFPIPHHWNKFGAYDFGFNHPAAFGWFACDEDGNVYLYRELIQAQLRVDQFAEKLNKYEDTKELAPILAGHDCWAKKGAYLNDSATPPTIAEEMMSHNILLKRATIDRIQGASQLRKYLACTNLPNGRTKPRFFIFDTCPVTFDCLTRVQHDPDRMEDVLKEDAVGGDPYTGDDPYDMVRYALMSRPAITDKLEVTYPHGSKDWANQQEAKMKHDIEQHYEDLAENNKSNDEDWVW